MIKESKPKVSVITGYYNREEFVVDSIQSLLDQSYENLEIIIFDDASSDNTLEIINQTVNGDKRVKVIPFKENVGFVNGMIYAIEQSTGEFIAVHGSGDISLERRIEKQAEYLCRNINSVGVACFYSNVDSVNNTSKTVRPNAVYSNHDFIQFNPFSHGEVMFRKNVYVNVGGYRKVFMYSQDWDLWIRMSSYGIFGVIQEILYHRVVNFSGVSYNPYKLVMQKKFSLLAIRINEVSLNQQAELIERIELYGIDSFIKKDNIELQKMIFYMFNVLLFKNKLGSFVPFFENSFSFFKLYYKVIYFLSFIPGFMNILNFIYVLFNKIKKNEG